MRPRLLCLLLLFGGAAHAAWCPTGTRADEPWVLELDGAAMLAPLAPATDRFGPGGTVGVGVLRPLGDAFALGLRLRGGLLTDGPAPADPTLADPGLGDLLALAFVVRVRPLADLEGGPSRTPGLFVELGGGGALTGGLPRPSVEGAAGYLFAFGDVSLGPVVRWQTVFEVDNQLDGRPAHLLQLGLQLALFDARGPAVEGAAAAAGDRDGDGLTDDVDACPDEAEDLDGFQDGDGCPEPDNDADGVLDALDQCPFEPEDPDGWEDDDGCPERDNDYDGFPDPEDACPVEPEIVNGIDDEDGCPDEGLIELVDDRIVLDERVLFDFQETRVKWSARPVLMAIVELYRQHPEWTRVRIEGHADVRGTEVYNQRLSEARARRVREALVHLGIPEEVIDHVGHGETRPRAWGGTEAVHQANRRVEFVIVARREVRRVVSPGPSGGTVLPAEPEAAPAEPEAAPAEPEEAPAEREEAPAEPEEAPAEPRPPVSTPVALLEGADGPAPEARR